MTISSSMDVFFDQLKDLRSATGQTVDTLPDLIGWAGQEELREKLYAYSVATEAHLEQILVIFHGHDVDPGDDLCKAMAGLIEGGNADCTFTDGNGVAYVVLGGAVTAVGVTETTAGPGVKLPFGLEFGDDLDVAARKLVTDGRT